MRILIVGAGAIGLFAIGQIARRYNLPFRSGGGFTSSQMVDAQAGYEALMEKARETSRAAAGNEHRITLTPDAIEKLLEAVRPLTAGRVITVFGCGGDRHKTKRPKMARVCSSR